MTYAMLIFFYCAGMFLIGILPFIVFLHFMEQSNKRIENEKRID
jgi:pilus assembly protein TadC